MENHLSESHARVRSGWNGWHVGGQVVKKAETRTFSRRRNRTKWTVFVAQQENHTQRIFPDCAVTSGGPMGTSETRQGEEAPASRKVPYCVRSREWKNLRVSARKRKRGKKEGT